MFDNLTRRSVLCVSPHIACRLGTEHNRIITSIIQAEARATSEEKFDSSPGSASVKRKSSADEAKNKHIAKRAKTQKTRGVVTQANTLQGQQLPVIADMMGGVGTSCVLA